MANTNDNNIAALGRYGVAFTDTADVFTPPSGMVIIALQFLDAGTIHTLTAADTDSDKGTVIYLGPKGS